MELTTQAPFGFREYHESLLAGSTSCEETVETEISSIEKYARKYNAFTRVFSGREGLALSRARQLDARVRGGGRFRPGPLFGLPVTLKDNIFLGGFPTTNGSEFFSDFVPPVNAEIVDILLAEGAVPLGKTNLHELALGVTGTSGYGGPIRNPVDPARISGGSSGGSAVSVRLAKGPIASIGSDTGGSVRVPAALCGVCGFKPSQWLLSTNGVFPLAPSLDHLGLFTRTMPDMSTLFHTITGSRPRAESVRPSKPIRIGVPSSYFTDDMDKQVAGDFARTLDRLGEQKAARVSPVKTERDFSLFSRSRGRITCREGSWFYEELLRSSEARKRMHKDVLALMDRGLKTGAIEYTRAMNARALSIDVVSRLLSGGLDVLAMPTCLVVAPRVDEVVGNETGPIRSLLTRNTELFNMCGFPALSIPMSLGAPGGLPTALQLVGRFGEDGRVLAAGEYVWNVLHTGQRNQ
ncbi:MAG: amidase [Thaumarchaeota archaeon]|nr:amidase [Nitrososphaerota archaeon]